MIFTTYTGKEYWIHTNMTSRLFYTSLSGNDIHMRFDSYTNPDNWNVVLTFLDGSKKILKIGDPLIFSEDGFFRNLSYLEDYENYIKKQ